MEKLEGFMNSSIDKEEYIKIINFIKSIFKNDCSGHDYFHSLRVFNLSMTIAECYECDKNVIMYSSLLHDVDDKKLFNTNDYENARKILAECQVSKDKVDKTIEVISGISYKGKDAEAPKTIEGKIVQDADRIDAIGAIGIARAFAYGGSSGREMYNPDIAPCMNMSEKEYRTNKGTTINHFYEKLLNIYGGLNTECAKKIANSRQEFMKEFLVQFYDEWDGMK